MLPNRHPLGRRSTKKCRKNLRRMLPRVRCARNRETRRDSESLGYIDREHGNQQPQPISEDEKKKRHFASFGDTDTQKKKQHTHDSNMDEWNWRSNRMLVGCMPHKRVERSASQYTRQQHIHIHTQTENVIYSALYQLGGWTVVRGKTTFRCKVALRPVPPTAIFRFRIREEWWKSSSN